MKKYTNKKFGFSFEYSGKDWETKKIVGDNPGLELRDARGLKGDPKIIVRVWREPQVYDDYTIMRVGKTKWVEHPVYGKSLEYAKKHKDFEIDFLLTGGMDEALVEEFRVMAESLKIV